jgi:two-component system, sensor histidine kinase and response regulator
MIKIENETATTAPPREDTGAVLEPVDILIVDDRPDGLLTLEAVLKGPRYRLTQASSGREAVLRARERPYAVILLDVQMPGMDGFEAARRIRQIESARTIPIIFVTAINKDIGHVYEGYDSGAVDYIFKPFDPRVLSAKVSVFVELFRQTQKLERQSEKLRELDRARFAEQLLERERANVRALEEKKLALERSNHDLEQFAYVASHDLQEPLRKVTTFMDLLKSRYTSLLPEEAQKFVGFAVDGATRMHDLIQGLLAYSRVDKGINKSLIDSGSLLLDVYNDLAHLIRDNDARVEWEKLPVVNADPTQLRQVFQNLIGNAIKFRNEESPRVRVSATESPTEWIFSIADNGIGIEPEYADRIFLIFQRLHPQGRYPGSGIGLSICKKIIERHNGRIWFDSSAGKGATFHFTLAKN